MRKKRVLYLALAAVFLLYWIYLYGHRGFIAAAYGHMFPNYNYRVKREILVCKPADDWGPQGVTPDAFERAAKSPETVFYRNIMPVADLAWPIERPQQRIFFLHCDDRIARSWAGYRLVMSEEWLYGARRTRLPNVDFLIDDDTLKVLVTGDHSLFYVFYSTNESYEKSLRFLTYLQVAQHDPRVSFTSGTLPLSSLCDGGIQPFRLFSGRQAMAFVTDEAAAVDSSLGSLIFRSDGGILLSTRLAGLYGGLNAEAGPQGTLDLRNPQGELAARFGDYGFSCGEGLLLYGTFFEPRRQTGYLAVAYDFWREGTGPLFDNALCWIEAEDADARPDVSRSRLDMAYGGAVLRLEQPNHDSPLTYRFSLAQGLSGAAVMLRYSSPESPAAVSVNIDGRYAGEASCAKTRYDSDLQVVYAQIGPLTSGDHTLGLTADGAVAVDCLAIVEWPLPYGLPAAPDASDEGGAPR